MSDAVPEKAAEKLVEMLKERGISAWIHEKNQARVIIPFAPGTSKSWREFRETVHSAAEEICRRRGLWYDYSFEPVGKTFESRITFKRRE